MTTASQASPEQSLSVLLDSLQDHAVFTTDAAGIISNWPANAEGVLGFAAAEALGKSVSMLFTPEDSAAQIDKQQMKQTLIEGKAKADGWYIKADGTRFWANGMMYRLADPSQQLPGVVYILSDGTEEHLRQTQTLKRKDELEKIVAERTAELRAQDERWASTLQQAAVGIALSDPSTARFLDANDMLCQMLGYTVEELRARTFYDLTHPDDLGENHRLVEDLIADRIPSFSFVKRMIRQDGSFLWVHLSVALARDGNRTPRNFVSVIADITAQLNAERELRNSNAELRRANAELEQFAFVSSHDLQEPLRTIQVYTQLFLRRYDTAHDPVAKQYADFITESVTRMQRLIDDLLDYSRTIHTEKHEQYRPVPTDINASLSDAIAILQQQIQHFKAVITSDVLPVLNADRELISQVFQSLISNALKFRKSGEVPRIHISVKAEQGEKIICVQDNGIGFEQKYAERIFGLFKRLHRNEYAGTGLGLAIAKRIVDRFGGRIWATSQLNQGSTFYFTLPQV